VAFQEGFIDADGFRIRYLTAGQGTPLVHLHGAGGLLQTQVHELLTARYRVILFEMPGFGSSPENTRTNAPRELAATMLAALAALGIDRCNLMATSFGARVALWMALQRPGRVQALVLEGPGAIRPPGHRPPSGTPEQMAQLLFAHPERHTMPAKPPEVMAQQRALTGRLRGPDRDPELEAALQHLQAPTLVLFGNLDRVMPPEMGRHYKKLLPNCHLVFVHDAGHEISIDRPEAVFDVVADFLERHEAFVISRTETIINP
jgi:pimeloyl-ACP methyl ester carboxylesterase